MTGLVLLYALSFIPVHGAYGPAINTAREAALMQTGIRRDFEQAKSAAEAKLPPMLRHGIAGASALYRRELIIKTQHVGSWKLKPGEASATFAWEW